jgi:hypothetical protein
MEVGVGGALVALGAAAAVGADVGAGVDFGPHPLTPSAAPVAETESRPFRNTRRFIARVIAVIILPKTVAARRLAAGARDHIVT